MRYTALGWKIFPLAARTKDQPLISNGSTGASSDENQVREWWTKWPTANIALATGHQFFALDADPRHGGDESLESLELKNGKLPPTLQQMSGGGGYHRLFQIPAGTDIRNSQSKVADGIDIRGKGGYIVVSPSIHPDTGRQYEWDGISEFENQPIYQSPQWLIDLAKHDGKPLKLQAKLKKGEQHLTLVRAAGSMRRAGFTVDEIFAAIWKTNIDRCEEPGSERNIRQIAESAGKWEPGPSKNSPKSQTFTNGHASNAAPATDDKPNAPPAEPPPDFTAQLALRVTEIVAAKDLTDATGAYSPTFFALCVQAGHVAAFNARQALKKAFGKDLVLKGVPGAWDNRYQAAVDQSRRLSSGPHEPSWRDQIILTDKGGIAACYENAALHAENAPEWAGVLGYNEFTGGHVVLEQGPYPLTAKPGEEIEDHFDTEVTRWFERQGVMVKPEVARRTVDRMARMNAFHPVRDYLNALPAWDGVARAADWLIQYCKVAANVKDDNDKEVQNLFAMDIGQRFLISAVARIFEPGCKADHVLMLEGKTGIGKSTLCEVLCGDKDFFTDQLSDLGSKDASMQVRGIWMAELADIHALSRSDRERAKAFITQRFERFRLPYGKRLVKFNRQCVFIGTTESSEWNTDERGARRFWPVLCEGNIDIDGVVRDRDQLWAEALYQYRRGHKWHIVQPDVMQAAETVQASRYAVDVWQQHVISAAEELCLGSLGSASISDILTKLKVPVERQDKAQANRVGACLRFAKWDRRQVRSAAGREYRYFAPIVLPKT